MGKGDLGYNSTVVLLTQRVPESRNCRQTSYGFHESQEAQYVEAEVMLGGTIEKTIIFQHCGVSTTKLLHHGISNVDQFPIGFVVDCLSLTKLRIEAIHGMHYSGESIVQFLCHMESNRCQGGEVPQLVYGLFIVVGIYLNVLVLSDNSKIAARLKLGDSLLKLAGHVYVLDYFVLTAFRRGGIT